MVAEMVIKQHTTSVRRRLAQMGVITATGKFAFEQLPK